MYEDSISLLRKKGVTLARGLTTREIERAERVYNIKFPKSLKTMLMMAMPTGKGFYNWRDMSDDNIDNIKETMKRPYENINNMAEEIYWCDTWGAEPESIEKYKEEVRKRLKKAPKLIPVYAHRYMPMLDNEPPILSIHDTDVIYYGENLENYLEIEFGDKDQRSISIKNIKPVQFWSDII